ncbi:alkane 1-monooxygenase [Oceaniglobus indicus]|uniref:alkane 1-monooxygenase n=1 Tax=Oceaniglobus indicus TaxID=2047749 RepID=UPI000C17F2D7|nr:alkane 1-monooxygenase [Oceaniglobus indicus]
MSISLRLFHAAPLFAIATLGPVPLLLGAAWLGGAPVWIALVAMTGFVPLMDLAMRRMSDAERAAGQEFPAGTGLSVTLAMAQPLVLISAIAALSGAGAGLGWAESFGVFLATGLWLGQVGNSNAHELIHRPDARLFRLGKWLFISVLFGHHTSAHRRIHHRFVASRFDPNSAPLGESFYAYLPRAWFGSFTAGREIETSLLRKVGGHPLWRHPYVEYVGGALACLVLAALIGGLAGVAWYLALAFYAQAQLLLSDYVQHYGLERAETAPGRLEPVGPAHSWNAPQRWSGAMMLNAPRHSDHHAHPAKPFPALQTGTPDTVPTLPYGLPVMATLALVPPVWHRLMDRRARRWRPQDRRAPAA